MTDQVYCVLDYETRSEADLKKVGQYEYSKHHSTQILCASWRVGTRLTLAVDLNQKTPAKIWTPAFQGRRVPRELIEHFVNPYIKIIAHNAGFEQRITDHVLFKNTIPGPPNKWICTASMAAALALPRNLEGACLALNLPIQKDMDGRRLMLKLSKPRKPSKNNPAKWHCQTRDLKRIMQYCQNDVDAETLLFLTLPELNETERKVWLLDQTINQRGFKVDRELVTTTLKMIAEETKLLNRETRKITNGELVSTNQRNRVLQWLHDKRVFLPDLRAKTVADSIREGLVEGDAKRLLEIRQAVSKTSTAKYHAFDTRSSTDGRVRDILVYHTASTGRWGGAGVQPQNFPRGTIDDTTLAASVLKSGDLEFVRLIYGDPMAVFSSCLRSVIIAPKDKELFCADYAAIEARVLFWVAEHVAGIKSFKEETPMYEELAAVIFNVNHHSNVTKAQRQVGKQAFLGCGYGMGWKKFLVTCQTFGIEVDETTAQMAVGAYRNHHNPVVKLWGNLERAAIAACSRKGTKFTINKTKWWVDSLPGTKYEFLWCELPSGRRLAYAKPQVKYEKTPWDEKRAVLYHWGINPMTRKWEESGTYGGKLCENVVQAIARDIMAEAMLRVEENDYELILSVHDELVAERQKGFGSIVEFENLMAEIPGWANGCPIKVTGWSGDRYKK